MRALPLPLPLLLSFCLACQAAPGRPAGTAPADPETPEAPPPPLDLSTVEYEPPPQLDFYYLVFLRRGPRWTAEQTEETRKLSEGHMANIQRLAREGKLVLAGPFLDAARPGDLAGIFVFAVRSLEEVKALVESDPAVKAGRFDVEIRAWMAGAGLRTAAEAPPPEDMKDRLRCLESDRHREFDFWVGEWTVTNAKGEVAGRNRIEKGQYGCVLRELWTGKKGVTGQSVNYVDPTSGEWVQLWTDATGGVIHLRGGLEDGAMALSGEYLRPDGSRSAMRATWTPLEDGRVRQLIKESTDGGKTWSIWFDGLYQRAR